MATADAERDEKPAGEGEPDKGRQDGAKGHVDQLARGGSQRSQTGLLAMRPMCPISSELSCCARLGGGSLLWKPGSLPLGWEKWGGHLSK